MSIIVKNGLFSPDEASKVVFVEVTPDSDPLELKDELSSVEGFRIHFPSSADGRGFSIARTLRNLGFKGYLRASGHVLADQYPLAVRCGFDDVEISADLADRQPEAQWLDAYSRVEGTYRETLMQRRNAA